MTKRLAGFFIAAIDAALAAGAIALPAGAATVHASGLSVTETWSVPISDAKAPIFMSSPTEATLDSTGPVAVVGDESGKLYAVHLSNGSELADWPRTTGVPIDAAPSTSGPDEFVGEGNTLNPAAGGLAEFTAGGSGWFVPATAAPGDSATRGTRTGLAVGSLDGRTAVVSGSMSQFGYALDAATGTALPGWPFLNADSDYATPAIADLYGNGVNEVIEGGDSTANPLVKDEWGVTYQNGGHVRVIDGNGTPVCEYNTNQVVQSSPAVGDFLSGGNTGIVVGTGTHYTGASNTDQLLALNSHCDPAWAASLDGATGSSPALVDALGNGQLQVVEGTTSDPSGRGTVYLLNGTNGSVIWKTEALGGISGSVASADFGEGYQDIVVTSTGGVEILDGRSGAVVWSALAGKLSFLNAPLITADPNGQVGITVAGYGGPGSEIVHFEVAGSAGGKVSEAGAWPMFHHDAQLTGDAGTPERSIEVPCAAPSSGPAGYWLAASDGGIFNYGNLPFCGSTGGIPLDAPVVGIAGTSSGGGYWLVASDGGIFSFGNAKFYGSTGGVKLRAPVVAMARAPGGQGYWEVASDGGVFAFGDAKFYGSTGGVHLDKPIVGIAPTKDGGGYWLVASDGGVFAFGDAKFHGSTGGVHLDKPIVGIAPTKDGGGYWLVASDGGIFAFGDAKFHGSTGGVHLDKPIVGIAPTSDSGGYWLVASDGGIFAFGDAKFDGSTGGVHLVQPVVGMAGY